MWETKVAQRFRAFLHSLNRLAMRKDARSEAQRNAIEGEAAQIGLKLQEDESKGRPQQKPPA